MKEGWCPEGISKIETIADTAEEQLLTKMRKAGSTLKGRIQDHVYARLRFCLFMQPASGGRETAISRALKSSISPCDWTSFSSAAPTPPPPPRGSVSPVHLAEQVC
ncbi:hypothetical protein EYF80_006018 [Liparis tanakae]|uniref:Uncharacterized protein n=1 Tax=Liparis tanakae TaxID=230148 RepID=A0A4Z2J2X5_9TELE|nr:hypothetical protein EYF80_006018 [Liparis tanakae]